MADPKRRYDTGALLETMMNSSGLTAVQKRKLKENLASTGTLPAEVPKDYVPIDPGPVRVSRAVHGRVPLRRDARPTIKPKAAILAAEPYEREQFRPRPGKHRTSEEKERLQDMFEDANKPVPERRRTAGGVKRKPAAPRPRAPAPAAPDRASELVAEIDERREFLESMRALGAGRDYEATIKFQIAQRLKELAAFDATRAGEIEARETRRERAAAAD